MKWSARTASLFRLLFRKQRLEDQLDDEVRACFDMLESTDPGIRLGQDPECVHQARVAIRLDSLASPLRIPKPS